MRVGFLLALAFVFLLVPQLWSAHCPGVVISVGKDEFAVREEDTNILMKFKIGEELRRKRRPPPPYDGKLSDLKKGLRIVVRYKYDGKNDVCTDFQIVKDKK